MPLRIRKTHTMDRTKHYKKDDLSLLNDLQSGNKIAYKVLFQRYYPMLCTYCNKFTSLEDSEEIVQDLFLWIWNNKTMLDIQTTFNQYLFKAVYRRAINRVTQNQAQLRANTHYYEYMQEMLEDVDFYQMQELRTHIENAINKLPDSYRESFIMHRFEQMTYKEIADKLNVSPKTIDYRIQQALKLLRSELKDYLPAAFIIYFL